MKDPIERADAIDALDEQITQCDKALGSFDISMKDEYAVKVERASLKAYRETLNVLPSAQPEKHTNERTETHACDSISRQKAIDTVKKMRAVCDTDSLEDYEALLETAFEVLPSAQPQRTGHWIEDDDEMFVICSECGEKNDYTSAYCPDCGTRMERY